MFGAAPDSIESTCAPDGLRYYPVAVSSEVTQGSMELHFVYSSDLHERSTIAWLADEFRRRLATVVGEFACPA